MSRTDLTRRSFLRSAGALAALGLGAGFLKGCSSGGDPCADVSGLSAEDKRFREENGYRTETLIAAKRCDGCEFWLPPAGGEKCGRCSSINGPISP